MSSNLSVLKTEQLKAQMQALGIFEEDIKEQFIHSSGPGGQKVNKTSSAVRLLHLPTGIEVKCQIYRSQHLNRYKARVLLCEKREEQIKGLASKKQQEIEKIRRQKRKRSKRAKEKILAEKKKRSETLKQRKVLTSF